jgi:hypothetical protein
MADITGTVTESLDPEDWIVRAHVLETGAYATEAAVSAGNYTLSGLASGTPYMLSCHPKMGRKWVASTGFDLNDYCIPTAPATTPYLFKATGVSDSNIKFWMPCNGTNASTSMTNKEITGKTVTRYGDLQFSTAQSKFGGSSLLSDGTGDYFTCTHSDLDISTGDFTFEFWYRTTSLATIQGLIFWGDISSNLNRQQITVATDGSIAWFIADGSTSEAINSSAAAISINTWHHVAGSKSGSSVRMYVDGNQVGTTLTQTLTIASGTTMYGMSARNGGVQRLIVGNVDDIVLTKSAKYTGASYTVPTVPYGTGTTEPTWDTTTGNATNDGELTWSCKGRMVQPIMNGPVVA